MIIQTMDEALYNEYIQLVMEYLPGSDPDQIHERCRRYPKAFLAAMHDEELVGVAFGWARELDAADDSSFVLNGIAVSEKYQKKGYGEALLSAFEKSALEYGYHVVSVGSAGGYVEHFYITNGYRPICYKASTTEGIKIEHLYLDEMDYENYQRLCPEGFVVLEKEIG